MEKIVTLCKGVKYLYVVSSVNLDKVTLSKHTVIPLNTFNASGVIHKITDDTKVGTVTQKMSKVIIPIVSKKVDCVAVDFSIDLDTNKIDNIEFLDFWSK